jgi:hypothetical protein
MSRSKFGAKNKKATKEAHAGGESNELSISQYMGYYTELVILASVRKDKAKKFKEEIANPPAYKADGILMFIALLQLLPVGKDGGLLAFKSRGHPFWSDYDVDEEYGTVEALIATWHDPTKIAQWLSPFVTKNSQIIFHSIELDGGDFAFDFDGKGKYRYLEFRPTSGWRSPKALKLSPPPKTKAKARVEKLKDLKRSNKILDKKKEHQAK